jgi:hypothetical protein
MIGYISRALRREAVRSKFSLVKESAVKNALLFFSDDFGVV